ncbi:MAG: rhodanese-related sulfurtransferase [Gammaproteobacteria bacterium]
MDTTENLLVATFYKFVRLPDHAALRQTLLACCQDNGLHGSILLAPEGINGTIAGSPPAVLAVLDRLRADPRFADLHCRESRVVSAPFHRMKVKLKKEIVTLGREQADPSRQTGKHIAPADWNALISAEDMFVLDTRNHYEHSIGTFANAVSAATTNFREFPDFVEQQMQAETMPRVAMFCTGGIRCEKASAWLLHKGFKQVYQLQGGILNYLENISPGASLWQGECFVFDNRVALDHELEEGSFAQCFACRRPLSAEDMQSAQYQQGVSCPHCYAGLTESQKQRFGERQKQVKLAAARNTKHIAAVMPGNE